MTTHHYLFSTCDINVILKIINLSLMSLKNRSPIPLLTEILAQSEICPFALQREAIIGHELAHYKENHSFLNVNLLLLLSATGFIMVNVRHELYFYYNTW